MRKALILRLVNPPHEAYMRPPEFLNREPQECADPDKENGTEDHG